jgi:hypothetical protein
MAQVAKLTGHRELPVPGLNCATSDSVGPASCQFSEPVGSNQSSCSGKWNW